MYSSPAAFFTLFNADSKPSACRRFIGKVKRKTKNKNSGTEAKEQSPEISVREKEVDDGESTGGEEGEGETYIYTERGFASKPQRTGGSKVCALHHNGHPVTNTDEPGACDAPFHGADISLVNKWSLHGNQCMSQPHFI